MNGIWEYIEELRSNCPSYHCRSGQTRPDKIFAFNVDNVEVKVCHVCYHTLKKEMLAVSIDVVDENKNHQPHRSKPKMRSMNTQKTIFGFDR